MFETDILVFIVLSWFKHQSKPSNVSFANCENTVSSEHELTESIWSKPDENEEHREADNSDKFDLGVSIQTPSFDLGVIMFVIST